MTDARRILIVEDDDLVARELALRVGAMGYQISDRVVDATSAFASVETTPPDLALIDIMLGGQDDGIRVASHLRDRGIPSLYLTAYADDALFERARISSPYAYLLKPYNDRELQLAIELAVQRHREEKQRAADAALRHATETAGKDRVIGKLETLLTAVIDGSTDSIFAKDRDGRYILCNHGVEVLLQRPRAAVLGRTDQDLFPPDEAAQFRRDDLRLQDAPEAVTYEETVTGAQGPRTFLTTKGSLRIGGEACGVFGISRDISERKDADRRILRLSAFYNVLAQTGQAIAHADSAATLLQNCCEIVVNHGQIGGAWIGFLNADGWLEVAAGHGLAKDYLAEVRVSIDGARPEGGCQTGFAMRENRPMVFNDFLADPRALPWQELARSAGVRASAAVPIRRDGSVVGALTVYAGEANFFDSALLDLLGELAGDISFALTSLDQEKKRQQAEAELHGALQQLHVLSARLIDVQEAERRSLARDLHDDIGQNLTMLKIMLHTLAAAHPGSEEVGAASELADRTLQRIRALSFALRPPQLDDLGLIPALRAQLEATCRPAGLATSFSAVAVPKHFPDAIAIACFRIVQEALTNIVRHAAASAVTLSLRGSGSTFQVSLHDNGRGFDVEAALKRAAQGKSLGLLSMRERAALAGGRLSLVSRPGDNNLRVVFNLPEGTR